jgi:hypothetical protein
MDILSSEEGLVPLSLVNGRAHWSNIYYSTYLSVTYWQNKLERLSPGERMQPSLVLVCKH